MYYFLLVALQSVSLRVTVVPVGASNYPQFAA